MLTVYLTGCSSSVRNPFKYTSEIYDEETGLYYLRARYYNPITGRFLNKDKYEGDISNPLSLNLYSYVHNNPLKYVDPSGNVPVLVALLGRAILNYSVDVMIGVATDYLTHVTKGSYFNLQSSLKKNAVGSLYPGLSLIKKAQRLNKIAKDINKAIKKAKGKNVVTKRDELLNSVSNKKLKNIIGELYRPGAIAGDGGTADAIRYEVKYGILTGGKSHMKKALQRIKNLENIMKTQKLNNKDWKIANDLYTDLKRVIYGK